MEEFLSEEGNRLNIMRKIDKIREEKRRRRTKSRAKETRGAKKDRDKEL